MWEWSENEWVSAPWKCKRIKIYIVMHMFILAESQKLCRYPERPLCACDAFEIANYCRFFYFYLIQTHMKIIGHEHIKILSHIYHWMDIAPRRAQNVKNSLPLKRNSFFNLDKSHVREHDHNKVLFLFSSRSNFNRILWNIFSILAVHPSVVHSALCNCDWQYKKKV